MREKRKYVRSNGLVLVEYKNLQFEGKSSAFDSSGAGVRITTDKQVEVGTHIELEIYLPGDSQPIKASGVVVWVQKCPEKADSQIEPQKEYFYTGIKFAAIDENSRNKIAKYVCKKLRETKN